jgi:hypothetical protein
LSVACSFASQPNQLIPISGVNAGCDPKINKRIDFRRKTHVSAWKTNSGDRPSASAQAPNAETMRKSCIAKARRLTGYRMFIVSPIPLREDNKHQILTDRPRFHSHSNARRYLELTNRRPKAVRRFVKAASNPLVLVPNNSTRN